MENKKKREEELKAYKKKREEKEKNAPKKEKEIVKKETVEQFKKPPTLTPNNILFIENLSTNISEPMLKNLFAQYLGFREVRILSGKGIAFIEYDNEINAGTALVGR
jgi:RNA recognition motif-containing protein